MPCKVYSLHSEVLKEDFQLPAIVVDSTIVVAQPRCLNIKLCIGPPMLESLKSMMMQTTHLIWQMCLYPTQTRN